MESIEIQVLIWNDLGLTYPARRWASAPRLLRKFGATRAVASAADTSLRDATARQAAASTSARFENALRKLRQRHENA